MGSSRPVPSRDPQQSGAQRSERVRGKQALLMGEGRRHGRRRPSHVQPYSKREGSRGTSGVKRDGRRKKEERTESSAWSSLNLVGGGRRERETERQRRPLSETEAEGERGGGGGGGDTGPRPCRHCPRRQSCTPRLWPPFRGAYSYLCAARPNPGPVQDRKPGRKGLDWAPGGPTRPSADRS